MRISIDKDSDFSIHNLPFGIYSLNDSPKRVAVAIGDFILDLVEIQKLGIFDALNIPLKVLENDVLNDFIGLGNEMFEGSKPLTGEAYDILIKVWERSLKNTSIIEGML